MYHTKEITEGGPDGKGQVCKGWHKKEINYLGFYQLIVSLNSRNVFFNDANSETLKKM